MNVVFSFVIAFLVSTDGAPTFAFLGEAETLEQCTKIISELDAPPEHKKRMGCLYIGREGGKTESKTEQNERRLYENYPV